MWGKLLYKCYFCCKMLGEKNSNCTNLDFDACVMQKVRILLFNSIHPDGGGGGGWMSGPNLIEIQPLIAETKPHICTEEQSENYHGIIANFLGSQMSVQNFISIHLKVEIFQFGPTESRSLQWHMICLPFLTQWLTRRRYVEEKLFILKC